MKLSKIISLLLVPLLLFALALPAYADGGSESYLIYFETNTPTADEGFSFRAHAGTFLVAGTMFFTLVALYAR